MAGLTRLMDPGPAIAPGVHPLAVVDPSAEIGAGAAFGPFVFGLMFALGHPELIYWLGVVTCVIGAWITWHYYARPGAEKPS